MNDDSPTESLNTELMNNNRLPDGHTRNNEEEVSRGEDGNQTTSNMKEMENMGDT